MLAPYFQEASPTLFFSSMFKSPPRNFHDSESVEIDIVRSEEDVSIAIQDISAGYRNNTADLYTNKEFIPPVHKEAVTINANTLLQRVAGQDPFADTTTQARLIARILQALPKPERKIRRAMELQASQVLQLGVVTLSDSSGNAIYSIDYKPKATHLVDVSVDWGSSGDTPLQDIRALADVIRGDGLVDADQLIFGDTAFDAFINATDVQALFDNKAIDIGSIKPEGRGNGATFQGTVKIGSYRFEMWTYQGRYKHPQTGVSTRFMNTDKVIVRASNGRLDASFGNIPKIVPPDSRILPFLPDRIASPAGGIDLIPNAWIDQTGENLSVGVGARPLMIPTAIDTFGCLDTTP